jgi:hypothetical protein
MNSVTWAGFAADSVSRSSRVAYSTQGGFVPPFFC